MLKHVRNSIVVTHEVQMDDQANWISIPFEIAYLAGLVFYPPSSYTMPPSFVVDAPLSFAALQVVFAAPPSVLLLFH